MTPSQLAASSARPTAPQAATGGSVGAAPRATVVIRVGDALVEVAKSIPDAASSNDGPCTQPLPRLRDGKPLPGPEEWRSLEAHAARLRLRGGAGRI